MEEVLGIFSSSINIYYLVVLRFVEGVVVLAVWFLNFTFLSGSVTYWPKSDLIAYSLLPDSDSASNPSQEMLLKTPPFDLVVIRMDYYAMLRVEA